MSRTTRSCDPGGVPRAVIGGMAAVFIAMSEASGQACADRPSSGLGGRSQATGWNVFTVKRANWVLDGEQAVAEHSSQQAAGDFNGDGYDDALVSSYLYDGGEPDEGIAFVYLGSPAGLGVQPAWRFEGGIPGLQFGRALGCAGDVNADGFDDIIVGAPTFSADPADLRTAAAYLFLGSPSGPHPAPDWIHESHLHGDRFGRAAETAGDVNGDGYSDVIIGAYYYDVEEVDEGAAWVFHGSATGLGDKPDWTARGGQAGAGYAWGAGTAGDVNGDGFDDVIVGAPRYDNGAGPAGRAFVYLGSETGLSATPAWTVPSPDSGAAFGQYVASAGDVNADGFSDVIVNARRNDRDCRALAEGAAFLYLGSAAGLSTTPDWISVGHVADAYHGHSARPAGDINADGYDDIVIGQPYTETGARPGLVKIYLGSGGGLDTMPSWIIEGDQAGAQFGSWATGAGDIDGDGLGDLLASAWRYDHGEVDEGRSYLFLGSTILEHPVAGALRSVAADYDADGKADLFWRHPATGGLGLFGMSGAQILFECSLATPVAPEWDAVSTGDLNGDGRADLLWRDGPAGRLQAWLMDGVTVARRGEVDYAAPAGWSVAATGDFNADGCDDLLWRHGDSGEARLLLLRGVSVLGELPLDGVMDPRWETVAVGDFNADRTDDILWQHTSTGEAVVSLVVSATIASTTSIAHHPTARVAACRDFNGDGRADILWQEPGSGGLAVFLMDGATVIDGQEIVFVTDPARRLEGAADFDGDGRADILWRDSATGELDLWIMDGAVVNRSVPIDGHPPIEWQILNLGR